MQSRTSCFNKAVFKKNLTRFSPVWVLYTICLLLGMFLAYSNGGTLKFYWFANNMAELIPIMGVINLGYALLTAQILFGDLYNSRMCNMLHAMPLRRESWFMTNVASGMVFSLLPTAIMTLVSVPLLSDSIVEDAWQIAGLLFAAANLEYICFFGMAVFAAMCVGNRFTMVAGYGLLNAGAYIVYWLIDTVYTPMLYGIITPTTLSANLTPLAHMVEYSFIDMTRHYELIDEFGQELVGATAQFQLTEHWWRLLLWAGVGIVFAGAALVLYRKRHLECAGDAVSFRPLVPVFQVLCALFVMTASQFFLYAFLGMGDPSYLVLAAGLIVGWFIGRMLIERSTRVFRLRNWYGLGALAAALVLTLVCTHFDVLNIEARMPRADKVQSVSISTNYSASITLESEADIQEALLFHELALADRAERSGAYVLGTNGEWVRNVDTYSEFIDEENENPQYRYVARVNLRYTLKNGNTVRREYNVWVDSPAGELLRSFLNRWDSVNYRTVTIDNQKVNRLDLVLNTFQYFSLDYVPAELTKTMTSRELAESFLQAVKADCEEGSMVQDYYFHSGHFRIMDESAKEGYYEGMAFNVTLVGTDYNWSIGVYPDSKNTLRWLEEHGILPEIEIREETLGYY